MVQEFETTGYCEHFNHIGAGAEYDLIKTLRGPIRGVIIDTLLDHMKRPRAEFFAQMMAEDIALRVIEQLKNGFIK